MEIGRKIDNEKDAVIEIENVLEIGKEGDSERD